MVEEEAGAGGANHEGEDREPVAGRPGSEHDDVDVAAELAPEPAGDRGVPLLDEAAELLLQLHHEAGPYGAHDGRRTALLPVLVVVHVLVVLWAKPAGRKEELVS